MSCCRVDCACGRSYTRDEFFALEEPEGGDHMDIPAGPDHVAYHLVMRQCACSSTISLEVGCLYCRDQGWVYSEGTSCPECRPGAALMEGPPHMKEKPKGFEIELIEMSPEQKKQMDEMNARHKVIVDEIFASIMGTATKEYIGGDD